MTSCLFPLPFRPFGAQVAQSVEQGTENPRVGSSILSLGTSFLDSILKFFRFQLKLVAFLSEKAFFIRKIEKRLKDYLIINSICSLSTCGFIIRKKTFLESSLATSATLSLFLIPIFVKRSIFSV